ncbi:hypothetical protein HMPREF9601_00441 [Cutibacterium acnes HL030PA1]|nr:hypothetical protein HMPREF9610_00058 [Cutibacterium acnes HL027PA2]EFT79320.1 hypothetical protein HMPREF9601_00441 [Cutibacterium acnes HL030PA1]EFT82484.1 hypothetical protein HMPREF9602_01390 [Cutibacterium acnes HL030PA2]
MAKIPDTAQPGERWCPSPRPADKNGHSRPTSSNIVGLEYVRR